MVVELRVSGSTARLESVLADRTAMTTAGMEERRVALDRSLKPPRVSAGSAGRREASRMATRFASGLRGTSTSSMCEMADGEPPWAPGKLLGTGDRNEASVQGSGKSVDSHHFFFFLSPFLPPLPPPRPPPLAPPALTRCSLADLLADLTASQPPPR